MYYLIFKCVILFCDIKMCDILRDILRDILCDINMRDIVL